MAGVNVGTLTAYLELKDHASAGLAAFSTNLDAAGAKATQLGTTHEALGGQIRDAGGQFSKASTDVGTLGHAYSTLDQKTQAAGTSLTALSTKLEKVGASLERAGGTLTARITAPIVALGTLAIASGTQFISTMNKIQAVTDASAEDFTKLNAAAIEWGQKTQFSAGEAADAMLELSKAGFTTTQTIAALPPTLQLAAASGMSLADSANFGAHVMKIFGLEVEDLGHINNVMARAANASTIEVSQLREAFKYVGPVAAAAGVSLETTTAAIALMGDEGIEASMAGTALRHAISNLETPLEKQAAIMKELGIQNAYANGKLMDLPEIIDRIQKSGADGSRVLALFGDVAGPGMQALVHRGGEALKEFRTDLINNTDAAEKMQQAAMKGLPGALEQLKGSINTAAIALVMELEPALSQGANALQYLADRITDTVIPAFHNLPEGIKNTALAIVGIGTVTGPTLFAIGAAAKVFNVAAEGAGLFAKGLVWLNELTVVTTARTWILNSAVGTYAASLGFLAKGILIVGTAYASWEVGSWIGTLELWGGKVKTLTDVVEKWAANLFRAATMQKAVNQDDLDSVIALDSAARATGKHNDALEKQVDQYLATAKAAQAVVPAIHQTNHVSEEAAKKAKEWATQLENLREKLSGSDLLDKAKQYEIVLTKIGGASHLTTKETEDVASAYTAVIEKYKLLGPAGEATVTHFQALLAPLTAKTLEFSASLAKARGELAGLSDEKMQQLTEAVLSGAFSMKQLEASSGLSEAALKLFQSQVAANTKEMKASNSIFDDYHKKIATLTTGLAEAIKFDAPIEFIKRQFGTMMQDVVDLARIQGKKVPKVIEEEFLKVTIKDGADHLLKEFARFGEDMNKRVKSDLDRMNASFSKTLGIIVAAQREADDDAGKFQRQGLANEIKNLEAISGVTKTSLALRKRLYDEEYQAELASLKRHGADQIAAIDVTYAFYDSTVRDALDAINLMIEQKMDLAKQKYLQQLQEMKGGTEFWSRETVASFADAFKTLEGVTSGSAHSVVRDIGLVLNAMELADKAGNKLKSGGLGNKITGALEGYAAISQATNFTNPYVNAASGAATGASMGAPFAAATGGWSVAIGAIGGAIYGYFKSQKFTAMMAEVGRDWGVTITKALGDEIKKDANTIFGGSRQAAEIFDLNKILSVGGGLNTGNLAAMTKKFRDVFVMLGEGTFTAAQAVKVLDDNWQQFAEAGTDANGRLSTGLKEMIQLTGQAGLESKAMAEYMKGQGAAAITGFSAVVAGTALTTQQALSDLGVQALASIGAAVAAGMTMPEALAAAGPALKALTQGFTDLDLDIDNAALRSVLFQSAVLDANPQLMAAIGGLSQEMIALDNLSALNADTFGAMERTGFAMYTRLQASAASLGGVTSDALIPMQKWLHDAADQAELLKIPIDDNTQMLIDQSKELGIWKDKGKTATETLTDGMTTLVDKVGQLITALGNIHDVRFTVTGNYAAPVIPSSVGAPPGFATGTMGKLIDFGPRGTLVTLHGRERVQTEAEVKAGGDKIIDLTPLLAAQRKTLESQERLNDYLMNRMGPQLARVVRDEGQKAARR